MAKWPGQQAKTGGEWKSLLNKTPDTYGRVYPFSSLDKTVLSVVARMVNGTSGLNVLFGVTGGGSSTQGWSAKITDGPGNAITVPVNIYYYEVDEPTPLA